MAFAVVEQHTFLNMVLVDKLGSPLLRRSKSVPASWRTTPRTGRKRSDTEPTEATRWSVTVSKCAEAQDDIAYEIDDGFVSSPWDLPVLTLCEQAAGGATASDAAEEVRSSLHPCFWPGEGQHSRSVEMQGLGHTTLKQPEHNTSLEALSRLSHYRSLGRGVLSRLSKDVVSRAGSCQRSTTTESWEELVLSRLSHDKSLGGRAPAESAVLASCHQPPKTPNLCTTIAIQNVPKTCSTAKLSHLLNKHGLQGCYDFAYVPISGLGLAEVNMVSHEATKRATSWLGGCCDLNSSKEQPGLCVTLNETDQGLEALVKKYERSVVLMSSSVPEDCKPTIFDRSGRPLPFPCSK